MIFFCAFAAWRLCVKNDAIYKNVMLIKANYFNAKPPSRKDAERGTKVDLVSYFKRGLIPGPSETEEVFLQRVAAHSPLPEWSSVPPLPREWGFSVDWVPLIYSKKKLLPWEGAICRDTHIQLHPVLQTKSLYGNSLTDILHHESIHAAREAFHEPQFEEFLAYSTSPSPWKRFLGPLFNRIWEFPLFVLCLFSIYTLPIPAFFLFRLFYKQHIYHRVKKRLPLPILLCLTDQEIRSFAFSNKPITTDFSLRGQLISVLFTRACRQL